MEILIDTNSSSPEETYNIGVEFGKKLSPGAIVCFYGDLGVGKTTCIKGICSGLRASQHVTSPTFTLINEYDGRLPIYHFDFYRLGSADETLDMGLDEYFNGDGVCLIEWPEIVESLIPSTHFEFYLSWDFTTAPNIRRIKATLQP